VNVDRNHIRLFVLGVVVAVTVAALVVFVHGDRSHDLVLQVEPIAESSQMTVYAGGAVARPGLYTLPLHARVATLLDQAGLLASSDPAALQLAAELRDGQQVIVPKKSVAAIATQAATGLLSSTGTVTSGTPETVSPGPIDVNSATLEQLESLPGIGPALAQRIIDYRNEHGPFASLDDLAEVRGISVRMVDGLRDLAIVGP